MKRILASITICACACGIYAQEQAPKNGKKAIATTKKAATETTVKAPVQKTGSLATKPTKYMKIPAIIMGCDEGRAVGTKLKNEFGKRITELRKKRESYEQRRKTGAGVTNPEDFVKEGAMLEFDERAIDRALQQREQELQMNIFKSIVAAAEKVCSEQDLAACIPYDLGFVAAEFDASKDIIEQMNKAYKASKFKRGEPAKKETKAPEITPALSEEVLEAGPVTEPVVVPMPEAQAEQKPAVEAPAQAVKPAVEPQQEEIIPAEQPAAETPKIDVSALTPALPELGQPALPTPAK